MNFDADKGTWAAGGISGTSITLNSPWDYPNPNRADGIWPIGTPVANYQSGGTYNYAAVVNEQATDTAWHTAGPVQVAPANPSLAYTDLRLRPGTKYVKFLLLTNRDVSGGGLSYRNFSIRLAPLK